MQRGARGARTIDVPRLLRVEPGALHALAGDLGEHFELGRVLVATGGDVSRALGEGLAKDLSAEGAEVEVRSGLVGSLADAAALLSSLDEAPASLVVGIGGGQPIDVAKLAACRAGVDLVAVPTVLSHDGMASPVASLTGADGVRRSIGAQMPTGVVIDVDVVAAAPDRYVRAGIGDLTSNLTAVDDWRAAHARGAEPFDEFAAAIAVLSAQAALDVAWPLRDDDVAAVARGLVMSGLAMEVAGSSRPCSGAEHLISHALDQLSGDQALLHGEHVAIGVLITSALQGSPHLEQVRRLFGRIGLPTSLEGWRIDEDVLVEAVRTGPATRPGRRTVLDEVAHSGDELRALIRSALG